MISVFFENGSYISASASLLNGLPPEEMASCLKVITDPQTDRLALASHSCYYFKYCHRFLHGTRFFYMFLLQHPKQLDAVTAFIYLCIYRVLASFFSRLLERLICLSFFKLFTLLRFMYKKNLNCDCRTRYLVKMFV